MGHLQQVLVENLTTGTDNTNPCGESMQELASKWTKIIEQKALRASMLSELYRKCMVSSVSNMTISVPNFLSREQIIRYYLLNVVIQLILYVNLILT